MIYVTADSLRHFIATIFERAGFSQEDANVSADVLLRADLRGIDSHGAARLSGYIRLIEARRLNPHAKSRVVHEAPSTATLDADGGSGLIAAPMAMEIAIAKAQITGAGFVAIKNSNHFGIAAYHAMKALPHNMIGFAMTNASPLVAPANSIERMLGTNPICLAIPAGRREAVVLDLATAAAANGKLEIAQRLGKTVPEGWIQTASGEPTTDPQGLKQGGSLLPLGGDEAGAYHKGFALGAWVDLFSGPLSGASFGPWVPPFVSFLPVQENQPGEGIGHFVGAWRVDGFRPLADFEKAMETWVDRFKASKPKTGKTVIIPGEPEAAAERDRLLHGIPLVTAVWEDLIGLSKRYDVSMPESIGKAS